MDKTDSELHKFPAGYYRYQRIAVFEETFQTQLMLLSYFFGWQWAEASSHVFRAQLEVIVHHFLTNLSLRVDIKVKGTIRKTF